MDNTRQSDTQTLESAVDTLPSETKRITGILVPQFTTERNFLKFPFFWLSDSKADRIEIYDRIERNDEYAEIYWKVTRGLDNSFPSTLARKIHKMIVEKIINEMPRPVPKLIRLGSLRLICSIIGSKNNTDDVKMALKDIKAATIECKGTFYSRTKQRYLDDSFNLYDRVFFAGQELPDGTIADAVFVELSSWYLDNINAGYTVPLDWAYLHGLKGEIASRMYELLSLDFFIALEQGREYVDKVYTQWCPYFPIVPQDKLWKARQQLRPAMNQLLGSGYLGKSPTFTPIPGRQADWTVRFHAGERAIAEYQQAKGQKFIPRRQVRQLQPPEPRQFDLSGLAQPASQTPAIQEATGLSKAQADYIAWLESQGVKDAKRLFASSPWKDTPETLEFIKQDFLLHCEEEKAGRFEFKKGHRSWLSWALSSAKYSPSEKLERKIEQRKRQEAERKRVSEEQRLAPLQEEYNRYVAFEIASFRDANPLEWQRLFDEELKKAVEETPQLRRLLEKNPKAMDRPSNRREIEEKRDRRVKKILGIASFEDWLKCQK